MGPICGEYLDRRDVSTPFPLKHIATPHPPQIYDSSPPNPTHLPTYLDFFYYISQYILFFGVSFCFKLLNKLLSVSIVLFFMELTLII